MKTIECILFVAAAFFYARTIHGNDKFSPQPVAFGIWLLIEVVNAVTYLSIAPDQWIAPLLGPLGVGVVFVWSLLRMRKNNAETTISAIEMICVIVSFIIVGVYIFTGSSLVASSMTQIVLLVGFIPIVRDILDEKTSEPWFPWFVGSIGYVVVCTDTIMHRDPHYALGSPEFLVALAYPLLQGFAGCFFVSLLAAYKHTSKLTSL